MSQISPLRFQPASCPKPTSTRPRVPIAASNEVRDPSDAESEVMAAMHAHIERTGRRFLTWDEVLEVLRELADRKS